MPERLTRAPGVEVPAPEDGSVLRYSGEAVQDVLDFFSLLCFAQNEWAGKPFELLPWEEEAVRQFYGIKPMKNRSIGRIDITVAWIIAMAVALLAEGRPPDLAEALSRPGYSL